MVFGEQRKATSKSLSILTWNMECIIDPIHNCPGSAWQPHAELQHFTNQKEEDLIKVDLDISWWIAPHSLTQ